MRWPKFITSPSQQYMAILVLFSLFGVLLNLVRIISTNSTWLAFLPWNLFLAWVPMGFAWVLYAKTAKHGLVWSKQNATWFILWFLFLPNAFYIVTDFIHLAGGRASYMMYDIVLLSTYSIVGILLGITSLLLVHDRSVRRFGSKGHWLPVAALLASGFAIYLGRYLRWNSWDIILNPFGLLYDVSDRVINPTEHELTFITTLLFFVLFGLLYWLVWTARSIYIRKK